MKKLMLTSGFNASAAKVLFMKKFYAKAGTVLFSTGDIKQRKNWKITSNCLKAFVIGD